MTSNLEELKRKRAQLTARIQLAESREKAGQKKLDDRVKVLVGAAVLNHLQKNGQMHLDRLQLLALMKTFLSRPAEISAVLGDDSLGSEPFKRLTGL